MPGSSKTRFFPAALGRYAEYGIRGKVESVNNMGEVAEYLKLSKITVYKLTQKGEIPGFRIGSSWRYNRDKIDEIARVGTKHNN